MSRNKIERDVYLTAQDIEKMDDYELIGVSRIALNTRLIELGVQKELDKEAISILREADTELRNREKKRRNIVLWGVKMTAKDVRRAFGDLDKMCKTSFKKVNY